MPLVAAALSTFSASLGCFALGYFLGRHRKRRLSGILCRVADGPDAGKILGLADDGTVFMDLRTRQDAHAVKTLLETRYGVVDG